MVAPVLFLVDDEPSVLDALAADLGRRLAGDYRIVAERSAPAGLAALERLAVRSEEVALVVAARQLAGMDGIDFLVRAHELHPGAKRVLLERRGRWTAGEPIVRALTLGQIDFLLYRPWVPLEQYLYPTVAEFLAAWDRTRDAAAPAVRIVGPRFQARSHELRDTLSRVGIPYAFHASDSERGRELLERVGEDGSRLPVLVFQTGRALVQPSHAELAEALGMRTRPTDGVRDLVVVGAGPAGLAAAVYAASEGLLTLVLEPAVPGGQAGSSSSIRNYLGFPRGVSGEELTQRAFEQAWLFGADFVIAQAATGLETRGRDRVLRLSGGGEVAARAVIVATGVAWRRLAAPGLEELTGAGVFYGAAGAEARAMRGEDVVVVGAGNSAGQAALHLARYAASVTIVAIEDRLVHMSDYLVQGIRATPNVTVRLHTEVVGGQGRGRLRAVALRDRAGGPTETLPAAALFVLIGAEPRTEWLGDLVERDDGGYLLAGRDLLRDGRPPAGWPLDRPPLPLETSLPGVFAAGDVRHRSVKRVASAVGAGAIAVQLVHEYLGEASG
jgi:thioredoxin reductase (NADPH)